jgi:adenosylhomocysteine nucleosidase
MEKIGLIAAMTQESNALLRRITDSKPVRVGVFKGRRFELADQTCVLVTSGMGIRRASEAARSLIEAFSPCRLISFGIAGAVEAELGIGDVVEAEAVCKLEQGVTTPTQRLEAWPQAAREAAAGFLVERGAQLLVGTAVTTGGSQVVVGQLGDLKHPILEMETAGIAQVAIELGIPVLSIRAISDGPCAPLPIGLSEIMDENANLRLGRMLRAVIRHPRMILQARNMMVNSRIAADNAALALIEVLQNHSLSGG